MRGPVAGLRRRGIAYAGSAAATAAGVGTGYALESITYKTFTAPLENLTVATLMTLERMDITVVENQQTKERAHEIMAKAGDRDVEIELDRLTSRVTRMRVIAKLNWLVRDRATATEIILQADRTLSDHPYLAVVEPRVPLPADEVRTTVDETPVMTQ